MSTRPPLIQYWHCEETPDYIGSLLASFREKNPELRHMLFDRKTAGDFIAMHFGERELSAFLSCAVPAMQSDYFRYCAVYALGGIYADADYACRRSLAPLLDGAAGYLFEGAGPIVNSLLAFRAPKHPLLGMAIAIASSNIEDRWGEKTAITTGPMILTALERFRRAGSRHARTGRQRPGPLIRRIEDATRIHGPVERAFEDVVICPFPTLRDWVTSPGPAGLPYKTGDGHWANWRGSMFQAPSRAERDAADG